MITGVVAQSLKAVPRGTAYPARPYEDADFIMGGAIGSPDYRVLTVNTCVNDVAGEVVFAGVMPQVLSSNAIFGVWADPAVIYAPRIVSSQAVAPGSVVFNDDSVYGTRIAIPDTLQLGLVLIDGDVVYAPGVFVPGAVTAQYVADYETIFVGEISKPPTLKPSLYDDKGATELFYVFSYRIGLGPPPAISIDMGIERAFGLNSTSYFAAGVATDDEETVLPCAVGLPATLDGLAASVTLSGGNLIATHSSTANNSGAKSLTQKGSTGKYYFEVKLDVTTGANDCNGILYATGTYTNFVTNGSNCGVVYKSNGNIWATSNASGMSLGALVAGDIISWAIDFGASYIWARKNGGLWNGSATANPVTNVGGVFVPTTSYTPAVGFGGTGSAVNDKQTVNFGGSAFAYPPPAGFGLWLK